MEKHINTQAQEHKKLSLNSCEASLSKWEVWKTSQNFDLDENKENIGVYYLSTLHKDSKLINKVRGCI